MSQQCEASECSREFEPKRSTARYCSATCRQRAARARKAAAESVSADAEAGLVEHDLVRSVRLELENADKLWTFNGQLALQLARKLVNPDESGATSLSKELRTVMAAALAKHEDPAGTAGTVEPEDDEVTRARRQREEIAAAAAAGAEA